MPAWCRTPDGQTAIVEIECEMKTQRWDQLSRASSKDQLDIGQDQSLQYITHLQCQFPDAQKDTAAWLKYIGKITGQAKQCKSASAAYTQASNQTHNPTNNLALSESRLKRKADSGLSQDARKEQDLDLTPAQEKLVAQQVNVPCVCAHVMVVVCAWCMC